jgi:MoxR-like ATPase
VPEELFGPLSLKALENDRYERRIEGWLPTATIAFLDEIFKANSAILNSLLTLLNEREFDNGSGRLKAPLVCVVAASNELPAEGEQELAALCDRFLLRYHVSPVTAEGFDALLDLRGDGRLPLDPIKRLRFAELEEIRRTATLVRVTSDVKALLKDLRGFAAGQKIPVSDRRWRKIVGLPQASAITNGRDEVSIWDCWLLQHCVGENPEHRKAVFDWFRARQGVRESQDTARFERVVATWEKRLQEDRDSRSHGRDAQGQKLNQTHSGKATTEKEYHKKDADKQLLYRDPRGAGEVTDHQVRYHSSDPTSYMADPKNRIMCERPALMQPTCYSEDHINGRVRQVKEEAERVSKYLAGLGRELRELKATIDSHLWIAPGFSGPAVQEPSRTRESAEKLRQRLVAVQEGFSALPREAVVEA